MKTYKKRTERRIFVIRTWLSAVAFLIFVTWSSLSVAVLSVVSSDQQEHSRLEFTLDVPVGELLQTYLSPNGRQLAVVLDVDADIAAWQGLARALVDADPLITRASSEGLRGGPGIVFQLAKPVRLVEERIAIVDAQTAQWFVELAVMPQ